MTNKNLIPSEFSSGSFVMSLEDVRVNATEPKQDEWLISLRAMTSNICITCAYLNSSLNQVAIWVLVRLFYANFVDSKLF